MPIHADKVPHVASASTTSNATFRAEVQRILRSDEPSPVTLWAPELNPFGVRFDFRPVQDEHGHPHELRIGPHWVEPAGVECYEVSAELDETLHDYLYTYELIARAYLEGRVDQAAKLRGAMLRDMQGEARLRQYEPHTRSNKLSWLRDYRAIGNHRGAMRQLSELWSIDPRQVRRRLEVLEQDGLLPEGLPRRKKHAECNHRAARSDRETR